MKDQTLEILTVFSLPKRVELMAWLGRRAHTVDQLVEKMPIARSAVVSHITRLRDVELVRGQANTRPVYYELDKRVLGAAITDFARAAGLELSVTPRRGGKTKTAPKRRKPR